MLITKIYINHKQIDEIRIQNVSEVNYDKNIFDNYKICKPKGVDTIITHKRSNGIYPLLIKALKEIHKNV